MVFLFNLGPIPGGQMTPVGRPLTSDVKIQSGERKMVVLNQNLGQLHKGVGALFEPLGSPEN